LTESDIAFFPRDACIFRLAPGQKAPRRGSRGHHEAVPVADFCLLSPDENLGIALDGPAYGGFSRFILVDIDLWGHPVAAALLASLGPGGVRGIGWWQETPARKGAHALFRAPQGWRPGGSGHVKVRGGAGEHVADVKATGYLTAPGSRLVGVAGIYRRLGDASQSPLEAPQSLLALFSGLGEGSGEQRPLARPQDGFSGGFDGGAGAGTGESGHGGGGAGEAVRIGMGGRDDELTALAGYLRRRGFGTGGVETALRALIASPFVEQPAPGGDARQRLGERDAARIARSSGRWEPDAGASAGLGDAKTTPGDWKSDLDVTATPEPQEWLLPGFVPAVGLTILYGDGKVGKSGWSAWLAAQTTRGRWSAGKPGVVVFVGSGEETFDLWVMRARASEGGIRPGCLLEAPEPARFTLPDGVPGLRKALERIDDVRLVYVDALYSHFAHTGATAGMNAAEKARACLRALGETAIERKIAVVGTIHENAAGNMLGSREMRNVSRSLLRATRKQGGDLIVWPKGGNGWQPDYGLRFPGVATPLTDAAGNARVFAGPLGETVEESLWALHMGTQKVATTEENDEKFPIEELK
jgi:hypothetical protein